MGARVGVGVGARVGARVGVGVMCADPTPLTGRFGLNSGSLWPSGYGGLSARAGGTDRHSTSPPIERANMPKNDDRNDSVLVNGRTIEIVTDHISVKTGNRSWPFLNLRNDVVDGRPLPAGAKADYVRCIALFLVKHATPQQVAELREKYGNQLAARQHEAKRREMAARGGRAAGRAVVDVAAKLKGMDVPTFITFINDHMVGSDQLRLMVTRATGSKPGGRTGQAKLLQALVEVADKVGTVEIVGNGDTLRAVMFSGLTVAEHMAVDDSRHDDPLASYFTLGA